MSNQRNADKDREIIAEEGPNKWGVRVDDKKQVFANVDKLNHLLTFAVESHYAWPHWLERAVSAEQRVSELEETLRTIMKILEPDAKPYRPAAYAYHEAVKALKGGTDND